MISPENLPGLKPLHDIVKRKRGIKKQLKHHARRLNLTKRARRFAEFPASSRKSGSTHTIGPNNYRMDRI